MRTITEPQDLRALAHPLRLRLLGALRMDGPATATLLAGRFGVSSGLTSYHLRALAERGFVEDDPGRAGGRERWWRASHDAHAWDVPPPGDDAAEHAGHVEAARALNLEVARIYAGRLEAWASAEPDLDDRWRAAGTMSDRALRLTPGRLAALTGEVEAVLDRYEDDEPGGGEAGNVIVLFAAYPEVSGPGAP